MTKLLKPVISLWRLWKKVKNLSVAYKLLPEVYTPVVKTSVSKQGNSILLNDYGKKYTSRQLSLFGKHGELLLKYSKSPGISFEEPTGSTEILSILCNEKKLRLFVHNYDNLQVIEEIFIDQLYDFHTQEKYIVCDVGMNVGAASLYFASFDNVEKVYGYEPFAQTYSRAVENIQLNAAEARKIEMFQYGLGTSDEWLDVPMPTDGFLGGSTTSAFIDQLPASMKTGSVKVEIKDACTAIQQIKASYPGRSILLKLDCEGAEYDIMNELEKRNMINDVAVYMIEFHFKGKKALKDVLVKNDFFVMSPVSDDVNLFGMLYAVKLKA